MDGQTDPPPPDARIAERAGHQHGVIAWRDLVDLGVGRGAIEGRLRRGTLHRVHRGVYAVGHRRLGYRGRCMAAALACGADAVVSYLTAADLWDLRRSNSGTVHVTVPSRAGLSDRSRIAVHRTRRLDRSEVEILDAIPITTVPRTLLDIADLLAPGPLERAVERSMMLRALDLNAMDCVIARNPGRTGGRTLRAILASLHDEPQLTRSELEGFFVDLCDDHGLPRPAINQIVETFEVDFLWRSHRLIVEADGRQTHATHAAFERDRARDVALTVAGYRVVRFTYRQIVHEPDAVARTVLTLLRAALSRRPSR